MAYAVRTRRPGEQWGILNYVGLTEGESKARKMATSWAQSGVFPGDQEFDVHAGDYDRCKPERIVP